MRCANWISSSDYSLSVMTVFSRAWNNGRGCDTSFDLDELVFLPRNSSAIPGTVISGLVPVTCCPNRSLKRYELALLFSTDITQPIFFLGMIVLPGWQWWVEDHALPPLSACVWWCAQFLFKQDQAVISCLVIFLSSSLSIQLIFGLERLWYLYWSCELTDLKLFPLPV